MADAAGDVRELSFELEGRELAVVLDEADYPRDAVLAAAYGFVDRCFVFLGAAGPGQVRVRLRARAAVTGAELEGLAQAFGESLEGHVARALVARSAGKIREFYMQRAFFANAPAGNTIDALLAELDAEELAGDPLEISVPWATEPNL